MPPQARLLAWMRHAADGATAMRALGLGVSIVVAHSLGGLVQVDYFVTVNLCGVVAAAQRDRQERSAGQIDGITLKRVSLVLLLHNTVSGFSVQEISFRAHPLRNLIQESAARGLLGIHDDSIQKIRACRTGRC